MNHGRAVKIKSRESRCHALSRADNFSCARGWHEDESRRVIARRACSLRRRRARELVVRDGEHPKRG